MMKSKRNYICIFLLAVLLSGCQKNLELSQKNSEASLFVENGFVYQISNDYVKITEYQNDEQQIVIPEEIDKKPVKIIASNAFYQHKNAVVIALPQSLTTIESAAFYRCYSLKSIVIPKNVATIEDEVFFRCSSLASIVVDSDNANYCDDFDIM